MASFEVPEAWINKNVKLALALPSVDQRGQPQFPAIAGVLKERIPGGIIVQANGEDICFSYDRLWSIAKAPDVVLVGRGNA